MPILNYTTEVPTDKTVAEIQRTLARAGAATVRVDYEQGEPAAVSFLLMLGAQIIPLPAPLAEWSATVEHFARRHRHCRPQPAAATAPAEPNKEQTQ